MGPAKMIEIRKAIKPLERLALAIYLYGSQADGTAHEKSDSDLCVVAEGDDNELYRQTNLVMSKHPGLDIKLFGELPLYLKKEVMENGKLLYCKGAAELSEYLRFYKRLWNEQAAVRLGYAKPLVWQ